MKMKNFWLMLKQGLKGVFQFKAQFIIIIILAFVATFILSISVSTQRRVQDSFNKIVRPVDKFKYSGNIQLHSSLNSNDDPFILASEVDNAAPVDYKITTNGKLVTENTSFNFITDNSQGLYRASDGSIYKSFLTEGTNEFIQHKADNSVWFWKKDKNPGEISVLNDCYIKELFKELVDISDLAKENKPLSSYDSQTKYSPIALYTYANPNWFSPFVKGTNVNDITIDYTNISAPDRDIFNNVVTGVSEITAFLAQNYWDYVQVKHGGTTANSTQEAIAFLFGEKMKGDDADYGDWIVTKDKKNNYVIDLTIDSENGEALPEEIKNGLATYGDGGSDTSVKAIWNSGLRGITNPFINGNAKNAGKNFDPTLITSWNNFKRLSLNPYTDPEGHHRTQNLYREIEVSDDFYQYGLSETQIIDFVNLENDYCPLPMDSAATYFRTHEELNAKTAGFNFGIRRESTYFDANNQLKFRGIATDPREDYNFTILRGRRPSGSNEVAISEQFAKKNKLKVGSSFKAGDAIYVISAIATDAFSYLPQQDLSNPIPNPSVSSFIYAPQNTINQMWAGSKTGVGSTDAVTENMSYFLFDSKNGYAKGNDSDKEKAFFALNSNSQDGVVNNFNAVKQLVDNGKVSGSVSSHIALDEFKKSSYRYSWTLQPLVFKTYDAITFIAAAIIAVIAIASIAVCVKKTIDLNSKQIGILKALGEMPLGISVNYLSYSIIVGLIVVPIAWIIGNLLQIPFGNMFFTYFSIQPDVILWDWISFVIAFGVMGVLSTGIAFFTAWFLTKKPVLSILVSSIKWGRLRFIDFLKHRVFRKAPFSTRFSLTLTSSGSRQIILMTVVMFVASLLMSASLAIPAVVTRVNSSYYKSVKYANQYDEVPMMGAAPMSKGSISDWNGQDYLESDYLNADLSLDNSGAKYGYYKDPESYTATVSNSSTLPQYLYDATSSTPGVSDTYNYILKNQQQLLAIVGTIFGNNYFTHLGVSFSVGMVDKFYGIILHSLENFNNAQAVKNDYTDEQKLNDSQFLSGWLTSSIPKIVGAIVNSNASSSGEDTSTTEETGVETWKAKVMDAIYKVVPSYVKAYIQKSDSRLDQYAIAYNNEFYIPGQETLTTKVESNSLINAGKRQPMTLTGLDKNQKSLVLDKNSIANAYLPDEIKMKLYDRLNVPANKSYLINEYVIGPNGETLYDGSTHTLTIPVVPNKQGASAYKLSKGKSLENWNNNIQTLEFRYSNNNFFDLPSSAWLYDDTDYASYLKNNKNNYFVSNGVKDVTDVPYTNEENKYNPSTPNQSWIYEKSADGKYYINPYRVNNNKITFSKEFNKTNTDMADRAQMFKEFNYDSDGKPTGTYLRPYYQYKNMRLMIPKAWVNEDTFLWPDGYHTKDGNKTDGWYKDDVKASDIPDSVKDGYTKLVKATGGVLNANDINNGPWLVINPYDLNYYKTGFQDNQKLALTNLVDGPAYWYRYSLAGSTPQMQIGNDKTTLDAFKETGAASDLKINLKSVGEINSYSDKLIVCDSDLANKLMQYPVIRDYEYNYQTFDKDSLIPAGETQSANGKFTSPTTSDFDRYAMKDLSSSTFYYNDWSKSGQDYEDIWHLSDDKYINAIGGNENILQYAPHVFFNSKYSNIDEPLEYSSQISFTKSTRIGQQAISLGDATTGGTPSIITSSTLLSTTKQLIKQVAVLAIAIGAMLVVAIIITAALLTMLTGDIYIEQYKRFMVLLRALGYSKGQIFTYTFGTVTILSFIAWVCGTILAWGLIYVGVNALWAAGFAIPMGITWWPIIVSLVIMFASYFGSLYVSSSKARKANPSEVLTATAE